MIGVDLLAGHLQPEVVEAAESGQVSAGEARSTGSVGHVEVFRMRRVGTFIFERPRPLSGSDAPITSTPSTAKSPFTRLILSLLATGIAPRSFYSAENAESRITAHFDGLPADFVAAAVAALGSQFEEGFHSYNVVNPHEDAVSLDVIVDWLIEAGEPIRRIDHYGDWFMRFDTAVRGLPESLRKYSVYTLMDGYRQPQTALSGSAVPADKFATALRESGNRTSSIPHITPGLVAKYDSGPEETWPGGTRVTYRSLWQSLS